MNIAKKIISTANVSPIQRLTVCDALLKVLNTTSRNQRSRRDWEYAGKRFLEWLSVNCPHNLYWDMLSRDNIRSYMASYDGKSANTIRLAMQPIIQASRFLSIEYGCKDIAAGLRLSNRLKETPPIVYLTDVVEFINSLHDPILEVGACLQGLAGLRVSEAVNLTWNRVNLDQGLIEISGATKNKYSTRVIPICQRVRAALIRAREARSQNNRIQEIQEHVIVGKKGKGFVDSESYTKILKREIVRWNPKLTWKVKDLRNCLPTFASLSGISNDIWEQYLGHAPRTVTATHYIPRLSTVSRGEKEVLEKQMDYFRLHVTQPLDKAIAEYEGENFDEILKVGF